MNKIMCDVTDCKHCNCDERVCKLEKIKICNCGCECKKEDTMCDSYKKKS